MRKLRREVASPEREQALVRCEEFERGLRRRQVTGDVAFAAVVVATVAGTLLALVSVLL